MLFAFRRGRFDHRLYFAVKFGTLFLLTDLRTLTVIQITHALDIRIFSDPIQPFICLEMLSSRNIKFEISDPHRQQDRQPEVPCAKASPLLQPDTLAAFDELSVTLFTGVFAVLDDDHFGKANRFNLSIKCLR